MRLRYRWWRLTVAVDLVEQGPTYSVIGDAKDPYTRRLLAAIPRPGGGRDPARDRRSAPGDGPRGPDERLLAGS